MIRKKSQHILVEAALVCFLLFVICEAGFAFQQQVVPVVDGHLGECSAEFRVLDAGQKPIYDAKIDVTFRHGFLGMRKMSLQVGTNSDGRARIAGLPEGRNKTYHFKVTSGTLFQSVVMNTDEGCDPSFEVTLEE